MSNLQHNIEADGYQYEVSPLDHSVEGVSYGTLACYAHFAKAFQEAQESWEKKTQEDPELKFYDSFYLYSMVLAADGMPTALVTNVDDTVQVFSINMGEKVEEDPK